MFRKAIKIFINLVLTVGLMQGFAQNLKVAKSLSQTINSLKIDWHSPVEFNRQGKNCRVLNFENVSYKSEKNYLPYFYVTTPCSDVKLNPVLQVVETETLTADEESCVNKIYLKEDFSFEDIELKTAEKKTYMF